jgi:hypothetical protein
MACYIEDAFYLYICGKKKGAAKPNLREIHHSG